VKSHVDEKIGSLDKFFDNTFNCDVTVGMTTHHHHKGNVYEAKVNLEVPGSLIRAEAVSDDLYKAINEVKDELQREIKKYNGKLQGR